MGRFFNKVLMNSNNLRGPVRTNSPHEKARRAFNEQNMDSPKAEPPGVNATPGGDAGNAPNSNPVIQGTGTGGIGRAHKGRPRKARPDK